MEKEYGFSSRRPPEEMSDAELREELLTFTMDPENPAWVKNHPLHKIALARQEALFEALYPDTPETDTERGLREGLTGVTEADLARSKTRLDAIAKGEADVDRQGKYFRKETSKGGDQDE